MGSARISSAKIFGPVVLVAATAFTAATYSFHGARMGANHLVSGVQVDMAQQPKNEHNPIADDVFANYPSWMRWPSLIDF